MNIKPIWILVSCLGLLIFPVGEYVSDSRSNFKTQSADLLSQFALEQAKATVVRIRSKAAFGSGILIHSDRNRYIVVTNRHVVKNRQKFHIQTPDNRIHLGTIVTVAPQDDLAILEFISDRIYPVAAINLKPLKLNEPLFAAGFPFNSDRLVVTSGKMLLETEKPLKQGYQIGYSNPIQKGMSGGAVFNSLGEVVGINGRSANPIIPDYQYQDLTYPSQRLQKQMTQLSWGIPIAKAIKLNNY